MRLTPLDIKKQEFTRALRGLDADEVQAFLNMMALQWEEQLAEHRRSEDKVRELQAKLEHYQRVEEALQEALQTARENAKQALKNAEQQAALLKKEAEAEAREIKREARREREQLQREVDGLQTRRDEIVARLRAFLHSEVELLARYDGEVPAEMRSLQPPTRPPARSVETTAPPASTGQADDAFEKPEGKVPSGGVALPEEEAFEPEPAVDLRDATAGGADVALDDEDDALSFRFFEPLDEDELVVPSNRDRRRSPERAPARRDAAADATWIVRPVVSAPREEEPETPEGSLVASSEEIEKIRRILSDLD